MTRASLWEVTMGMFFVSIFKFRIELLLNGKEIIDMHRSMYCVYWSIISEWRRWQKMRSKRMEEKMELMTVDNIRNRVYVIRGQQVMLDYDLAEIYGYEVKRLNEQVKRNIARFPEDFMFQLSKEEVEFVKSQIATSRNTNFFEGQEGGRRKLPYAFSEQGIYMLATVLRGEVAEQQSIFIMRAFREMRHYIRQNQQFVTQAEMNLVTARVSEISV